MSTAQRIVPSEPAAPPRARSYCPARISRVLAIPASARKWATGASAQQDSGIELRASERPAAESVPLRAIDRRHRQHNVNHLGRSDQRTALLKSEEAHISIRLIEAARL